MAMGSIGLRTYMSKPAGGLAHAEPFIGEGHRNRRDDAAVLGAPGAEPANELQAIVIWQGEIADHDVGNVAGNHLLGLRSRARRDDAGPERLQTCLGARRRQRPGVRLGADLIPSARDCSVMATSSMWKQCD